MLSHANCLGLIALFLLRSVAFAGYEAPSHIDGCQSADGRYSVTAELVGGKQVHGPFKWRFVWRDNKQDKTVAFDAKGVQGGQIYANLFMAPDGETFALFNNVTLWTEGKSAMHGASEATGERPGAPRSTTEEAFSRRLIIYRKDGTILKKMSAADFLTPEEWAGVLVVFNRVHWIKEYPGLNFKKTPRHGYALYRVSPDYTVLEFLVRVFGLNC